MSNRLSIKERTAVLRARPHPLVYRGTTALTVPGFDSRGRIVETRVSLSRIDLNDPDMIDALDVDGNWGPTPSRPTARENVTAAFCGDPAPTRSALFERTGRLWV